MNSLTMRNVHNAVADTIMDLHEDGILIEEIGIFQDDQNRNRYIIRLRQPHLLNSHLEIEIIEEDGTAIGSVIDRYRISQGTMNTFMDRLMENLEDD